MSNDSMTPDEPRQFDEEMNTHYHRGPCSHGEVSLQVATDERGRAKSAVAHCVDCGARVSDEVELVGGNAILTLAPRSESMAILPGDEAGPGASIVAERPAAKRGTPMVRQRGDTLEQATTTLQDILRRRADQHVPESEEVAQMYRKDANR